MEVGPKGNPETSVLNYLTPLDNPEDGRIYGVVTPTRLITSGFSSRYSETLSCSRTKRNTKRKQSATLGTMPVVVSVVTLHFYLQKHEATMYSLLSREGRFENACNGNFTERGF